jgi:Bacteriophage HK97-gp10, putative tail-component
MPARMTGIEDMKAGLRQAAVGIRAQMRAALTAEANRLLAEAQQRVPVESRRLRDSGRADIVDTGSEPIKAHFVRQ